MGVSPRLAAGLPRPPRRRADAAAPSDTTAAARPPAPATGSPIKIGFDEGFTGFMAYDCQHGRQGHQDGPRHAQQPMDGPSSPVPLRGQRLRPGRRRRQGPEAGGERQDQCDDRPDLLAFREGGGRLSGQVLAAYRRCPSSGSRRRTWRRPTAWRSSTPASSTAHGYYFGKYLAEKGYKTANVINYDDTPAHALTAGFKKAFVDEGGGKVSARTTWRSTSVDFSAYLSAMKPADVTVDWIFGNGAVPFVKQYHDYGLKAPLAVPMSNNFTDAQLAELGDISLGMIACDYYAYTIDNPVNKEFVAAFEKLYPGQGGPNSAGLWRLAGRDDVPRGTESRRGRHDAFEGHPGHCRPETRHAGGPRCSSYPSRTRSSRSVTSSSWKYRRSATYLLGSR